jgi:hypothetical protein
MAAALARGVLAWLAMVALGTVSALAVPGALWIVVAAAWTASDLIDRGACSRPWMERRSA